MIDQILFGTRWLSRGLCAVPVSDWDGIAVLPFMHSPLVGCLFQSVRGDLYGGRLGGHAPLKCQQVFSVFVTSCRGKVTIYSR